tara:strand:- start:216 stop:1037 length:822 start_codon:yes stop_codon:yes gene_type:complete
MGKNILTKKEFKFFQNNGFLIIRNFFKLQEIKKINNSLKKDKNFKSLFNNEDNNNKDRNILQWNEPGDDILGITSRLEKVVGTMEELMLDEVYHYHSKITDVPVGGSGWSWHQDYGYWYQNGCLFPDMASLFIPLDPCHIENGCLQIISKSHKLGRVDHIKREGHDEAIDEERLRYILKKFERIDCILSMGDVLFTHCNLLHSSNRNTSGESRRVLLSCYNTKHNNPVKKHHHPRYKPIKKMPDNSIMNFNENKFKKESDFINRNSISYPTLK